MKQLLGLAFFIGSSFLFQAQAQNSIEEVIGKKAIKTIYYPDNIWAYELSPLENSNDDKLSVGGFVANERIGLVPGKTVLPLLNYLKKDESFNWTGTENRIPFTPEVAFEFEKGGKVVICLLDFDANEVGIRYGKQLYRFEFDDKLREGLLKWLKTSFSFQDAFIEIE